MSTVLGYQLSGEIHTKGIYIYIYTYELCVVFRLKIEKDMLLIVYDVCMYVINNYMHIYF